jgi:hypothetical protein
MNRKLALVESGVAGLMALYRVEGTARLVLAITDFGHDYRSSFYEIKAEHRTSMLARLSEVDYANEVSRDRTHYGRTVDLAKLTRDPATSGLFLDD